MRSIEVKKYKDILEKKKEGLMASAPARTPPTEPGSKSGDWIDQASRENDVHVRLALKQTDAKLLRAIDEAIHRIEQGTYGICMECENEIAPARLTLSRGPASALTARPSSKVRGSGTSGGHTFNSD